MASRPKPWLKMWTEWVHDPKMLGLTLAEQAAWWRVVSLAQECNAGGPLVKGSGAALSINEIADTLHLKDPKNFEVLKSMLKKMEIEESLAWDHGALTVVHLSVRQELTSSETPEARRDRVRLYRERKTSTEPSSPPDPPITKDKRERERERESVTARNTLHVTENPLLLSLPLATIAKRFEENFGIITPILTEKFKDFVENYHGPVEWIDLAFAEAVKYKHRRWEYVEAILSSWQEKGGPYADGREPGGTGAAKPGAEKGGRFGGFHAIESGPDEPDDGDDD